MKKHIFRKALFILTAISLCSSLAQAQAEPAPTPLARCTLHGQFMSISPMYIEIFGLAGRKQFVRTTINGNQIEVPVINITPTWITFRSEFTLEGRKMKIDFSNYISPSIGRLQIDNNPHESIACELSSRKSQI